MVLVKKGQKRVKKSDKFDWKIDKIIKNIKIL